MRAVSRPASRSVSDAAQALPPVDRRPASRESCRDTAAQAVLDYVTADIHASEAYRRAMLKVFTRRALEGAPARA